MWRETAGRHLMAGPAARERPVKPVVIVIEGAPQVRRLLRGRLTGQGYRVVEAPTGAAGLAKVSARPPDIVLLALRLPDMDAVEVIRRLREWTTVPIIVLSARGDHHENVTALNAGADDYVSDLANTAELLARIRAALLRRSTLVRERATPAFNVGDLAVDVASRRVTLGGQEVHLTPVEYRMLTTLVRHAGKVITYSQLLSEVWGPTQAALSHNVHACISHLRHKLEGEPMRPRYLLNEPRVGYRLAAV